MPIRTNGGRIVVQDGGIMEHGLPECCCLACKENADCKNPELPCCSTEGLTAGQCFGPVERTPALIQFACGPFYFHVGNFANTVEYDRQRTVTPCTFLNPSTSTEYVASTLGYEFRAGSKIVVVTICCNKLAQTGSCTMQAETCRTCYTYEAELEECECGDLTFSLVSTQSVEDCTCIDTLFLTPCACEHTCDECNAPDYVGTNPLP
jgi:hypothetical protein